jgi:hypothetical protein
MVVRTIVVFVCRVTLKLISLNKVGQDVDKSTHETYGVRNTVSGQRDHAFHLVRRHGQHEFVLFVGVVMAVQAHREAGGALLQLVLSTPPGSTDNLP